MPNYIINRVVMTGEQSQIDEPVRAVQFSYEALGSVDFSKVIPIPPELDIPEGTDTQEGFRLYSDFVEVYKIGLDNRPFDPMNIPARAENAFLNYRRDISDRVWTLGRAAYRNYEKYGFKTWLDWRNKMWNTNSEGRRFEPFKDNTLCFETAWSRASPTIHEESLHRAIVDAINGFCAIGDDVRQELRAGIQEVVIPDRQIISQLEQLRSERNNEISRLLELSLAGTDYTKYDGEFKRLSDEIDVINERIKVEREKLTDHSITTDSVQEILDEIDRTEFRLTEYDDSLTRRFIERIDVIDKNTIKITFIGGYQSEQVIE